MGYAGSLRMEDKILGEINEFYIVDVGYAGWEALDDAVAKIFYSVGKSCARESPPIKSWNF